MSALTLDPNDAHLYEAAAALARRLRLLPGAAGSPAQLVFPGETIDIPPGVLAYRQIQDQRHREALANTVRQGEDLGLA